MPIDLLPPDDETFVKKKQVSEKQKNHLARARQAAIDRIQKKKTKKHKIIYLLKIIRRTRKKKIQKK